VSKRIGDKSALERVIALAKEGQLNPRVAIILPMEEATQAHELVEKGGLRGRVVLDLRCATPSPADPPDLSE
jgi:D-arabinose 1-dehydrogenase-like Zn-dependent alcohol dehydrogenase